MKYVYCLFILLILTNCKKEDEESAQYVVTFSLNWNANDFPVDYPSNAHFSKLIGWSHKSTSDFFQKETIASDGIENMAELGAISPLDNEINLKISNKEGLELVIGDNLGRGTGDIVVELNVNKEYSSVTLATMIAPSPDWYVAIVNINLFENGKFVDKKNVQGNVYDAGTDNGKTFSSENEDINPHKPISLFVDVPLGNGLTIPQISNVKFERKQ